MPTLPPARSLAAIVFTDVVGFSALSHRDDAKALRMVEEHFAIMRDLAARFGGRVIKTIGDSVHLEFASAQSATAAAVVAQQRHQQRNTKAGEGDRLEIRIGVHIGDIEHRDGDTYGDGVNIAARLQPLAPVGGVAISIDVWRTLREELRDRFTSRGSQNLKNIGTPIEMFTIEAGAIAAVEIDVPAPAARAARRSRTPIVAAAGVAIALVVLAAVLVPHLRAKDLAGIPEKSIAVLPFVNLSSDKEQEFFSDGIAEDLLNLLTRVQTLQVAARTSSFSFKGKDVGIEEIAVALRVAHVLEGSVRKSGNQVRITAQLVRAKDGYQIWSQSWDRQLDDVFKIQDEIAQAVVAQLKIQLLGQAPTARPIDPKVYPLILQADALGNQATPQSLQQAVELYEQALAQAPDEARAWAGLSRTRVNQVSIAALPASEGYPLARTAASRALQVDPANVIALVILGRVAGEFESDLVKAARLTQQALELEPGNLIVINAAGTLLQVLGRVEEAQPLFEYRLEHDPANPIAYNNVSNNSYLARKWQRAIDSGNACVKLSPNLGGAHWAIGLSLLIGMRDPAAAMKEFEAEPDELSRQQLMPLALHALGRKKEADAALQVLLENGQDQPSQIAAVYAYRGEFDAAFDWLDKAVAVKDIFLETAHAEPLYDGLRNDPRWPEFLRKIGRAPEQLAKIEFKVTLPQAASESRK